MKYNREFRLFQFAYFALYFAFASISVYMIPFLKQIGYDAWQRGVIFSGMALASMVMQWIAGYVCDKYHTTKKTFILTHIVMIVAAFFCYRYTQKDFWMHAFLIAAMGGLYKLNYNLLDSWSLLCSVHTANKFGSMRALGAIGFAVGTFLTSMLIGQQDYSITPYIVLIATLIGLLFCLRIPEAKKEKGWYRIRRQDFKELFETKSYVTLIYIFLLINIVGTADQYTTVDKLMYLAATKTEIGWKWAIQSLSEVPIFLVSVWLLKKIGGYRMMLIGMVFYIIKFIGYGVVSSVRGVLWITTMQTITYPLITLSSRTLFASIAQHHPHVKTSTQLIASSITLGVSALITPLLCGFLMTTFGHDMTLYILAISLIPVCIYALKNRRLMQSI